MYRDGLNLSRKTFLVLKNTGQIFQLGATKRQNELQDLRKSNQAHLSNRQNAPLFRDGRRHLFAFPEVSSPESVPSPAHTTVDGMTRSQSEWTFHRLLKEMSGSKKAAPVAAKAASSSDSSEEDSDEVSLCSLLFRDH
ncbi:hypothetical protein YC2023_051238 [Brassica napus]